MEKVYLVGGKRTPIGSMMGSLSALTAPELCGLAIRGLFRDLGLSGQEVDSVILGNVLSSGLGQNPARQAAMLGGVNLGASCTNVNKVCASGMKAAMLGALELQTGNSQVCLVGGFESMSNSPHILRKSRTGHKFGDFVAEDSVLLDGLTDATSRLKMGHCAEKTALEEGISREDQDVYCLASYQRSLAQDTHKVFREIEPVLTPKGVVERDEEPTRFQPDKISKAKLAFADLKGEGTVTTANASKLNDGACVLLLASETGLAKLGLKPIAQIVSFADAEVPPADFNRSPPVAARKALQKAQLSPEQVNFWEVNEAFSVTPLHFMKAMGVSAERVNVFGGAVGLGHPIGMSGARILLSLTNAMHTKGGQWGCATICNGGGGSSAVVLRRVDGRP